MDNELKIVSDNAKIAVENSKKAANQLIELWKSACIDKKVSISQMQQECYGMYYSENSTSYTLQIDKNILILQKYPNIFDEIKKTEQIDFEDLSFIQKVLNKIFGKIYTENYVYKKWMYTYILKHNTISTEISEDQFNLLADFFIEQKHVKQINKDLTLLKDTSEFLGITLSLK